MVAEAVRLLDEAGRCGADVACLPEYLNVLGCPDQAWFEPLVDDDERLRAQIVDLAVRHRMYVVLPLLEKRGQARYNTGLVIDRRGAVVGRYDKTHLTAEERGRYKVTPGSSYPVFDLDFGRIGIMICYDGHFPEVSRILALQGAEIIFFPSLQRHLTASQLEVQLRARAVDNCLYVARSSYGYAADVAWTPGMMVGKSCVVDFEGTILADAGPRVGLCLQRIDLDRPRARERSFGGEVGDARRFMLQDRRPDTYERLTSR